MESFLKEQLKRIQDLAKQLSSLEKHAAELTHDCPSERRISQRPLTDVKDFRTHSSLSDPRSSDRRATAADRRQRPRRRRRR